MENFRFWESWPRLYRIIWFSLAFLFAVSLAVLWIYRLQGNEAILHWEKHIDQSVIDPTVHTFTRGPFIYSIPAQAYVTFEYFGGSDIQPNHLASYLFVFLLLTAAVVLMSIITTLERFWFLVGTGLLILFLISLRPEVLALFGTTKRLVTIAVVAVYTLTAFYFNSLKSSTPFLTRLLTFAGITLLFLVITKYFAAVRYPILYLSVTGYTAGLIVTVLFILLVAHEIPAFFVYLSSQGAPRSLRHFSIISMVYLANLIVTYLHEIGSISWDLFLGAYLLLSISAILGIWGYRQREPVYENLVSFFPFGAYFYLSLGIIAMGTVATMWGTGNDPALMLIRETIIFGNLGCTIIFLTYVVSNFILPMAQRLPVYRVLYKPNRMPYITFRVAAIIAVLAFVFYSDWRQFVYQGVAGFYNSIGDLYMSIDREKIAEVYYQQGATYSPSNHHSNYALARMAMENRNVQKGLNYYDYASGINPSPYAMANAGNIELAENPMDGIREYGRGLKENPGSPQLAINLGYGYSRVHSVDSAVYEFDQAMQHPSTRTMARADFLALATQEYLPIKADSVLELFDPHEASIASNALALALQNQQPFRTRLNPLETPLLDLSHATLLNNYIVQFMDAVDTTFLNKVLLLATDSLNARYSEALKASLASAYYAHGKVYRAFDLLEGVAYRNADLTGKYKYIKGLWALEQDDPALAVQSFNISLKNNYTKAAVYRMLALAENRKSEEALVAADSILAQGNKSDSVIAARLKEYLTIPVRQWATLSDDDRYVYCHFMLRPADSTEFDRLVPAFVSNDHKALALAEMARKELEAAQIETAVRYYNELRNIPVSDEGLLRQMARLSMELLVTIHDANGVRQMLNGNAHLDSTSVEGILGRAFLLETKGDTTAARPMYDQLAHMNPYFETGVIAASNFYEYKEMNGLKAYGILADAVQVNTNNIRLLSAYVIEASRMGLEDYQESAMSRIEALKNN